MAQPVPTAQLPDQACLSINRCNLPCRILASLQYQRQPQPLLIDGVLDLHSQLFAVLGAEALPAHRAELFVHHMNACFQLKDPQAMGYDASSRFPGRQKLDYRQLLRGWLFNADGREAAIIKGWVESRFGLQTRNHGEPISDNDDPGYARFQAELARGLYNTNALHGQLDVLYSYCQYELQRQHDDQHLLLYRGINHLPRKTQGQTQQVLLLNNISSFTSCRERADEFGDQIVSTRVPLTKLLFVPGLIPGLLQGEQEHLVIGGLYEVTLEAP